MMNLPPQHIQKREIIDWQKIKNKYKPKKKHRAIQSNQKMPQYKGTCYAALSRVVQAAVPIPAAAAASVLHSAAVGRFVAGDVGAL